MVSRASISPSQTFPHCTTRRPPRPPPSPPATWAVAARVPSRARSCSPPRSASIGGSSRSVRPTVFRVALRPSAPDAPPPHMRPQSSRLKGETSSHFTSRARFWTRPFRRIRSRRRSCLEFGSRRNRLASARDGTAGFGRFGRTSGEPCLLQKPARRRWSTTETSRDAGASGPVTNTLARRASVASSVSVS